MKSYIAKADAELYSPDLDWFLTQRDAACGHSSSFGGFLATMERGGGEGAKRDITSPYRDDQAGLGPAREGAFARDRLMAVRWARLGRRARDILSAPYLGSAPVLTGVWTCEVHGQFQPIAGRLEKCPSQPASARFDRRCRVYSARRRFPAGVEARMGLLAGVAFFLAAEQGAIGDFLKAAERAPEQIASWRAQSEREVRCAHRAYYAAVTAEAAGRWAM